VRIMRASRVCAVVIMAAAGALLVGSVPTAGGLWRAADASGGQLDESGLDESGLDEPTGLDDRSVAHPAVGDCDWDSPPRPDSALDIPDPDAYIEDGHLPDVTVEFNGHHLPLAELVDIMSVAEDMGISVEEGIFRFGWQNQFAAIATELEETYPDRFAGAAIVNSGCGAWIAFTGLVPDLALELAGKLPVPVELIGDRGFAEHELVDALHEAYIPTVQHPSVISASGSPDSESGVITIYAQPRSSTDPAERDELCARLQPPPPTNPAITIQLILVEDLDSGPSSRTHTC
jgi:hypothetical protein